ncbi:porin family protein [Planktosalinus lacus]|uniref:Outer membrane protein beta-barrel domain-containing protein n=1 Tax=Planktosalinus lacus TaxID=1526573 RepID=A0A8J2V9C3_9FLAO|nr:porin family protein [Planktosalinus lacus]GGD92208.1 hypothetical protein GCM10011312_14990 [Planktosalinus lacus]
MKRIILLVVVMAFGLNSFSQGLELGVKFGANFSTLSEGPGPEQRTGFLGGAFVGIKFSDRIAIQSELLYSQQGAEFDLDKVDLNYVNLPVVMKLYLVKGLNIQGGPQFGFLVDDNLPDSIVEAETFDLSGIIGAGYDLPFGLRLDARYHFGVTEVEKTTEAKNQVFSLALGYSFL